MHRTRFACALSLSLAFSLALSASACAFDAIVDERAAIACADASECPQTWSCALDVGRCVPPGVELPAAVDSTATVDEDSRVVVELAVAEGDVALIVGGPDQGALIDVDATHKQYVPAQNYHGPDRITWRAQRGVLASRDVEVAIEVLPVNDAPTATDGALFADEDGAGAALLVASDIDGDPLSYNLEEPPAHGTSSIVGALLVYQPELDYAGTDTLRFTVSDGGASASALIVINVGPVNDAPQISPTLVAVDEDTPLTFTPAVLDVDGDPIALSIVEPPQRGTLEVVGAGTELTYTPLTNFAGVDSFRIDAEDVFQARSEPELFQVVIGAAIDDPTALPEVVNVDEDGVVTIGLDGIDPDGLGLVFTAGAPQHGALEVLDAVNGFFRYTPNADFNGDDAFSFTVRAGARTSVPEQVTIHVAPVDDAPRLTIGPILVQPGALGRRIPFTVVDPDGDPADVSVALQPQNVGASASIEPPDVLFVEAFDAAQVFGPDVLVLAIGQPPAPPVLVDVPLWVGGNRSCAHHAVLGTFPPGFASFMPIDPDDDGPLPTFDAHCDPTFAAGPGFTPVLEQFGSFAGLQFSSGAPEFDGSWTDAELFGPQDLFPPGGFVTSKKPGFSSLPVDEILVRGTDNSFGPLAEVAGSLTAPAASLRALAATGVFIPLFGSDLAAWGALVPLSTVVPPGACPVLIGINPSFVSSPVGVLRARVGVITGTPGSGACDGEPQAIGFGLGGQTVDPPFRAGYTNFGTEIAPGQGVIYVRSRDFTALGPRFSCDDFGFPGTPLDGTYLIDNLDGSGPRVRLCDYP